MNERIEQLLDILQLSRNNLADKLDIEPSSLSHYITGRNKPSVAFLTSLAQTFPQVNIIWLLTGEGSPNNSKEEEEEEKKEIKQDDSDRLPLFNEEEQPNVDEVNKTLLNSQKMKAAPPLHQTIKKATIVKIFALYDNGKFEEYDRT